MARRPRQRFPHSGSLQPVFRDHIHGDIDSQVRRHLFDPDELSRFA